MSHIVPTFVGKWLKESSVTGRIRTGQSPNKPEEDIIKHPLLCYNCEQLTGVEDRYYAETIFRPIHEGGPSNLEYDHHLIRYCSAQTVRTFGFLDTRFGSPAILGDGQRNLCTRAIKAMRGHLLSGGKFVEGFSHHLFFFGDIERVGEGITRPLTGYNRYCTRAIDCDIVRDSNRIFIYTKMCRVALMTYLRPANPIGLIGTKVVSRGRIGSPQGIRAIGLAEYFADRAKYMHEQMKNISPVQKAKISELFRANSSRIEKSETLKAMLADRELERMIEMNDLSYSDEPD